MSFYGNQQEYVRKAEGTGYQWAVGPSQYNVYMCKVCVKIGNDAMTTIIVHQYLITDI